MTGWDGTGREWKERKAKAGEQGEGSTYKARASVSDKHGTGAGRAFARVHRRDGTVGRWTAVADEEVLATGLDGLQVDWRGGVCGDEGEGAVCGVVGEDGGGEEGEGEEGRC